MTIDLTSNMTPLFAALTALALIAVAAIAAVGMQATGRRPERATRTRIDATARVLPRERPPQAGAA
jgi:hypothetical protein